MGNESQTPAKVISRQKYIENSTHLSYPSGAKYGITFDFTKYSAPQFKDQISPIPRVVKGKSSTAISLPLPAAAGLAETTSVSSRPTQLGLSGLGATLGAETLLGKNDPRELGKEIGGSIKNLFDKLLDGGEIDGGQGNLITKLVTRAGISSIGGTGVEAGLDIATGTSINNFTTLMFDDVQLRNYSFNWTLIPDEQKDAELFEQIRRRFQIYALPTYSRDESQNGYLSRVMFEYPYIVNAHFFNAVNKNAFFKFKPAMITKVEAKPLELSSKVVMMRDGRPGGMLLNVEMTEIAIWTAEDYLEDYNV
jgi:hypothetical protein